MKKFLRNFPPKEDPKPPPVRTRRYFIPMSKLPEGLFSGIDFTHGKRPLDTEIKISKEVGRRLRGVFRETDLKTLHENHRELLEGITHFTDLRVVLPTQPVFRIMKTDRHEGGLTAINIPHQRRGRVTTGRPMIPTQPIRKIFVAKHFPKHT